MAALTRRRPATASETGAELLEMAFILPLLLLVVAGIMDFGFLFLRFEVVTNAAREGARIGILPGYQAADVQQRVANYLTMGGLSDPAPPADVAYSTVAITPGGPTMSVVTVTAQYPSRFLFLGTLASLVGGGAYADVTLRAAASMRREVAAGP
jgi:Flp pilus assembly protein TadG